MHLPCADVTRNRDACLDKVFYRISYSPRFKRNKPSRAIPNRLRSSTHAEMIIMIPLPLIGVIRKCFCFLPYRFVFDIPVTSRPLDNLTIVERFQLIFTSRQKLLWYSLCQVCSTREPSGDPSIFDKYRHREDHPGKISNCEVLIVGPNQMRNSEKIGKGNVGA